ncbi:MAG: TonB-dependent receptor [Bryobacteraceae bacterium]
MHRKLRPASFAGLVLMIVAVVPPLRAQNRNSGEIRGTVSDATGASVAGVAVEVTNTDTSVTNTFRTDSTGTYDATPLIPGPYTVTFLKDGFQKLVRPNVVLHVGTITVNASLQLGSVSQQVTVASQPPLLQTESSERSLTLTSESATELPNVGRGWFNLIGQLPGTNGSASNSSINGTLPDSANWLADGGTATLPNSNNPDAIQVPLEAIGEIDINTSSFGAESGNGPAVFNVITKSGTNQFHGSLFEFVQNNVFNARNFFSPTVPPVRWNEFGGSVGGPIKRDRLFFFFAYQRNPNNSYSTGFYTYPTSAMRSGNFSGLGATIYDPSTTTLVNGTYVRQPFPNNSIPASRFDPVSQKIMQYYPNPTLPGTFNNYFFSGANTSTYTWYNFRVDYNIASGNRLSVSGMAVPQTGFTDTPDCPLDCQNVSSPEYTGQITDVWTPQPNLVNEFRTAVSRQAFDFTSPNQGEDFPQKLGLNNATANAFPNISVGGPISLSGIGGGTAARTHQTAYVTSDSVSLLLGKHTLKFGGEFDKWENSTAWGSMDAGSFNFSGIFTRNPAVTSSQGEGVADLLLGLPQSWNTYVFEEYGSHDRNLQAFIQDYYKILPNLTLNFGVRYMRQAGWTETYNRLSTFLPNATNPVTGTPGAIGFAGMNAPTAAENDINFFLQPRVGLSW